MTTVHVSMARDDGTGTLAALPGSLYWEPTTRREDGTVVVLPVGFAMNLVAGEASEDVAPSGLVWCWRVTERVQDGTVRYVAVPDSATTVEYTDLVDVDPDTLAAWEPTLAAVYQAALDLKADADSVVVPADLASVATSGDYGDLTNKPTYKTVTNRTGATIPAQTLVEIDGAFGIFSTVRVADNTTADHVAGITVAEIADGASGDIQVTGTVEGLNTSAFTAGAPLYLGTSGAWTETRPTAPAHIIRVGVAGVTHPTAGSIVFTLPSFELLALNVDGLDAAVTAFAEDPTSELAVSLSDTYVPINGTITLTATDLATDPTGEIQAAIEALEAGQGGKLHLPVGRYVLTDTLVIIGADQDDTWGDGGIEIIGAGMRGTVLVGPAAKAAINVGAAAPNLGFAFRDLTIEGPGKTSVDSVGVDYRTTGGNTVIDNVYIHGFEIGLRWFDNTFVDATHLVIRDCGTGLALGYYADLHSYQACSFSYCDLGVHIGYADTARGHLVPQEVHASAFYNCGFTGNDVGVLVEAFATEAISFVDCYQEQFVDVAWRIGDAAGARSVGGKIVLDNPYVNAYRQITPDAGHKDHSIEVNVASAVEIRGGGFKGNALSAINVKSTNANVLVTPGNYSTSNGESGSVKLPSGAYVTVGKLRPITVGQLSQQTVSFAHALPAASESLDGCELRVSGVAYECGSDGAGGWAWYELPAARQRGLTGTDRVFVAAADFGTTSVQGTATLSDLGGKARAWLMDASAQEQILASTALPSTWATFHIDFVWANAGAGTGVVRWQANYQQATTGSDFTGTATQAGPVSATAGLVNVAVLTRVASNVAYTAGNVLSVRAIRAAADAADTLPNDAALVGMMLTKAS